MSQEEKDKSKITIVVTGITGSGKSAACNFFLQQEAFKSKRSLKPVTKVAESREGIVGRNTLQLIDTPGFLDPSSATEEEELEELARAILGVPNGIHALGLVINVNARISGPDGKILAQLLDFIELIPYAFVIFSHAKELAEADDDQRQTVEEILNDDSECPQILSDVLQNVNHRYMVLESVKDMGKGYHDIKANELIKIVESILAVKKKPFTCFMTDIAKKLQQSKANLEGCVHAVKHDLQKLQNQLKIEKQKESQLVKKYNEISARSFWEKWSIWVATGMGATAGAATGVVLGPVGSAAGATLGASAMATLLGGAAGGVAGGGVGAIASKWCIIQ